MSMATNSRKASTEVIESKIDKSVASRLAVSSGGMSFRDMGEVMEFAKLMAISGQAVPPHLRNEAGICLAIIIQSLEWRMSPFAVANKSYVVNDRVSYESQLIHAVIEQRAPLVGRLRNSFAGAGDKRTCTVTARVIGEETPFEYTSPPIGTIHPKNSPLWETKPDLQLCYNTCRDWARMYFPDVILGVYSEDEMLDVVDSRPAVTSRPSLDSLTERLERTRQPESPSVAVQEPEQLNEPEPEPVQDETPKEHEPPTGPEAVSGIVQNCLEQLDKCETVQQAALIEQDSLTELENVNGIDVVILDRAKQEILGACKAKRALIRSGSK